MLKKGAEQPKFGGNIKYLFSVVQLGLLMDFLRGSALIALFVSLVHLWKHRSAGKLRHGSDDVHPPALQRGGPDHHLPLQELCGL